jgi:pyruvate,orthophosphate dikinase
VVAGIRTPQPLRRQARREEVRRANPSMEEAMPEVFTQLASPCSPAARAHYRDMQDIEFTIEQGKLYMLQTRNGKRTAKAALRSPSTWCRRGPDHPRGGGAAASIPPARPAAAPDDRSGHAGRATCRREGPAGLARRRRRQGRVRPPTSRAARGRARRSSWCAIETSPEDIHGMHAAQGILTTRGGMTSHAAVVARGMGKPCVSGAGAADRLRGGEDRTAAAT